jgi:type IV pilus assembly protein PilN
VIRINLLSVREVAREAGRRREMRLLALGAVLVAVVVLAIETGSRLRLAPVLAERAQLEGELKALAVKAAELDELEQKRKELDEKLKTIKLLEEQKVGPVSVLSNLSDATPEKVWLLEFTENGGAATVTGMALDNQTIAVFMRELAKSSYFADVDLVETTLAEQDGLPLKRFVVRARLSYSGRPLPPAGEVLRFPDPPKGKGGRRPAGPSRKGGRV